MDEYVIDGLGKKMVRGGRVKVAQIARLMRRLGGSTAARLCISNAAAGYIHEGETTGWSDAQMRHSRLVTADGPLTLDRRTILQ